MSVIDISSAFRGVSVPLPELYSRIEEAGWEPDKVKFKGREYSAQAKNRHGETLEKTGPDPQTAVGSLLLAITRHNSIRSPNSKVSAWTQTWDDQQQEIADAYAKASEYENKAAAAWKELADDSMKRADIIQRYVEVEIVNDPDPYPTIDELVEAVQKKRKLQVTHQMLDHPLWSGDQVLAFRIAFDVLGHAASGGGWDWRGLNQSVAAYMPQVSENAQYALFGEVIARAAYTAVYKGYAPHKIALFKDFVEPLQQQEQGPDHAGVHPSQSIPPREIPEVQSKLSNTESKFFTTSKQHQHSLENYLTHGVPQKSGERISLDEHHRLEAERLHGKLGSDPKYAYHGTHADNMASIARDGLLPHNHPDNAEGARWDLSEPDKVYLGQQDVAQDFSAGSTLPAFGQVSSGLVRANLSGLDPERLEPDLYSDGSIIHEGPIAPSSLEFYHPESNSWLNAPEAITTFDPPDEEGQAFAKLAQANLRDPNYQWNSGYEPLPDNAYVWGGDPLDIHAASENARNLDTGWHQATDENGEQDFDTMKAAVVQALRAAMLSPQKGLDANSIHYQDVMHVPIGTTDSNVHLDALASSKQNWNTQLAQQPQEPSQSFSKAHTAAPTPHRNWDTGEPCHCPYGLHAEFDPTLAKTAGNLDKLKSPKNRPDLQTPEGQQWLQYLESLPPKTDAIAPWMTREWKRGRIMHIPDPGTGFPYDTAWHLDPNGTQNLIEATGPEGTAHAIVAPSAAHYFDRLPPGPSGNPIVNKGTISRARPDLWADWHHSNHPNKQGVNIEDKDFQVPQMQQKVQEYQDDLAAKEREGYGEVVHQFPDNWSIRRLQNAEECKDEGKNMGHCAAQYGSRVENGANLMYSLRDPKNNPHATFDVSPRWLRDPDNPEGRIPATTNTSPPTGLSNVVVGLLNYYSPEALIEMGYKKKDVEVAHAWMQRSESATPIPNQGTFNQAFGKEDREPLPEYKDRIKQFMESMPEEERPRDSKKPPAINTVNDLLNPQAGPGTNEYGLAQDPVSPDYTNVVSSHIVGTDTPWFRAEDQQAGWNQTNQQLINAAMQRGELPQLQEATQGIQERAKQIRDWAKANNDPPGAEEEFFNMANDLASQIPQPQTTFSKSWKFSSPMAHRNWDTGEPCNCGWGNPNEFPVRTAAIKEASKLDWLRGRPDMQTPEAQKWLTWARAQAPKYDDMLPWLTREWKKGRLFHASDQWQVLMPDHQSAHDLQSQNEGQQESQSQQDWARRMNLPELPEGELHLHWNPTQQAPEYAVPGGTKAQNEGLIPVSPLGDTINNDPTLENHMGDWADWYHSNHPTRKGLDINSKHALGQGEPFTVDHMLDAVGKHKADKEAEERAKQTYHTFDNGYTIQRITNGDQAAQEGEDMHHCIGDYCHAIDAGITHAYSLRDAEGNPVVTSEIRPQGGPKHPDFGLNHMTDPQEVETMAAIGYPNSSPESGGGTLVQMQGPRDRIPHREEQDMMHQWFNTLPGGVNTNHYMMSTGAWFHTPQGGNSQQTDEVDPPKGHEGDGPETEDWDFDDFDDPANRDNWPEEPITGMGDYHDWASGGLEDYQDHHRVQLYPDYSEILDDLHQMNNPDYGVNEPEDQRDAAESLLNSAQNIGHDLELQRQLNDPDLFGNLSSPGIDHLREISGPPQQQQHVPVWYNPENNQHVMLDPNDPHQEMGPRVENRGTAPWQGPNTEGADFPLWLHRNPPPGFVPNPQPAQQPEYDIGQSTESQGLYPLGTEGMSTLYEHPDTGQVLEAHPDVSQASRNILRDQGYFAQGTHPPTAPNSVNILDHGVGWRPPSVFSKVAGNLEETMQHWTQFVKYHRSDLDDAEVHQKALRLMRMMRIDEENKIMGENPDLSADEVDEKANKELERRLRTILKPSKADAGPDEKMDFRTAQKSVEAGNRYPGYIFGHLQSISQMEAHADDLTNAALEDVHAHDGGGWHFRKEALSLGIPNLKPKVVSFAWLLLQPTTSQIAALDTHMAKWLGYSKMPEGNDRDYFRLERELQAGRDAAGYSHVPLGQFQWAMWDYKRNGPGLHQDHSAMRPLNPAPVDSVDWHNELAMPKGTAEQWYDYQAPDWWKATEDARSDVAGSWNNIVRSQKFPQMPSANPNNPRWPWLPEPEPDPNAPPLPVMAKTANGNEFHMGLDVPQEASNEIANWASQLNWPEGSKISDPNDYHLTMMYAPYGHQEHKEWGDSQPDFNPVVTPGHMELFPAQNSDHDYAVVMRAHSPELDQYRDQLIDQAEQRGLEPTRYPGGFKNHITVGYADEPPTGPEPDVSPFQAENLSVSTPKQTVETKTRMAMLRESGLSTEEVWASFT